jgi:YVTN family beta-propeller protein
LARRLIGGLAFLLFVLLLVPGTASARKYNTATYSSPIAMSADGKFVWNVNPGANNVTVIYTRTNRVIARIKVGDEPQSIALDPNNRYAYVANAASSNVTVIRITRASPRKFRARADRRVGRRGNLTTGAEPWNIVVSPDGRRVYVANSSQDTITVIDPRPPGRRARRGPRILGHLNLRTSLCNDPDRNRHFQPRGLAVTRNNRKLLVTSFFAFTRPNGKQGTDTGREGVVRRAALRSRPR